MTMPRLLFVTGKGGAGKTTVAAGLGVHLARLGRRTLVVETGGDRGLGGVLGHPPLQAEPTALGTCLDGLRLDQPALVRRYFRRVLPVPLLSDRLFASASFNALAAAAPGVTEFLILDFLIQQLDRPRKGPAYEVVVVDAPATGHAIQLLRTAQQLALLVPAGPLGSAVRRIAKRLTDHDTTAVVLVTVPEEMAVAEAIEAHRALGRGAGLRCARPILNRTVPRRFTAADAREIAQRAARHPDDPLLRAARLQSRTRRDVESQTRRLRRAFGAGPVTLPLVTARAFRKPELETIGEKAATAWR